MVGKTISHYEITEKLGEGGMGVVYKARDSHLKRFVALKVLPPEKIADPERKHRFVQEARAASALNHPNIVTVHDIDQADGIDFIAMEYVEGKTLDELIGRKGLKLNEALKCAMQIADALAKAHAAGIVHRDLKPGNVMLTAEGRVKVLDFGLAKLTEPAAVSSEDSLVTEQPSTETGLIVGTVSYMSPEQAEGKKVDSRSDIFSFGSVLYEMLTGRRPFRRDTPALTLAAILHLEPPPLPAETPADLEKLITRCLRKDPARRYQHMDDVKIALEELKDDSDSGKLAAASAAKPKVRRWLPLAATAAVLLIVATGWLTWRTLSTSLPPQRVVPLTDYAGNENYPSFSPDGSQVAFTWNGEKRDNRDIYVTNVRTAGKPLRRTTDPAEDLFPAWSPDGTQIAFVRSQGSQRAIYVVHPLVGEARKLADLSPIGHSGGPSWSPDGKWLAVAEWYEDKTSAIELVPVQSGVRRKLISAPFVEGRYSLPSFSPDGHFLAYALDSGGGSFGDLYLLELGADLMPRRQPRRLSQYAGRFFGITWTPDGRSVLYGADYHIDSGGNKSYIWRTRVDAPTRPERIEVTGEGANYPSVSRTGSKLAYSFRRSVSHSDIWRLEPGSPPVNIFPSTGSEWDPQFSPDGKRIAYVSAGEGSDSAIWVANSDGSNPVQLTERVNRGRGSPYWSPDGRWLAYDGQSEDGHWDIFVIDAAGGQPRRLTPYPSNEQIPSWSRDGKWIYFMSTQTGQAEVWRLPANGEGKGEQLTDDGGIHPVPSYDGETVYYGKAGGLYARSLAGGPERRVLESISINAYWPVKEGIFHIARARSVGPTALELRFFDYETKKSRLLDRFQSGGAQKLSVSPDRKTFLFSGGAAQSSNSDLMLIENFR